MKKTLVMIGILLLMTGCTDKNFSQAYNKMKVSSKGINGYTLDLRIYGINGSTKVNEIIRVENEKATNFKITKINPADRRTETKTTEEIAYIMGHKSYLINAEGKSVLTTERVIYANPAVYLEGLKTATKVGKSTTEKIGLNTYTVYTFKVTKKVMTTILKDTILSAMKITDEVTGILYIDAAGYVYRITYTIDKITVNASYFGIDSAREIILPN